MTPLSRILLVGSDQAWSIERFYLKYFQHFGIEAELFPIQNQFYQYYYASLVNKAKVRLGISDIFNALGKSVLNKSREFKPQVIWFFKGMEVLPSVLSEMRRDGRTLVNYNPDNPFIFSGRGSGNKNVSQSIPLYDLHFTYDTQIANSLREKYSVKTSILPFGFDLPIGIYENAIADDEITKACFLGNPDTGRAAFLQSLANSISIDVYGNGWQRYIKHENIGIYPAVYGVDFWKTLRRYRVQLNLMRPHNLESHNMRSFEVPAVGGIGLFPSTIDHRTYFQPGEEVFLYHNVNECISVANQLLSMSRNNAAEIRNKARARSLNSGYSYMDRTREVIEVLQEL